MSDKAAIILEQIEKGERDGKDLDLVRKYLRQSYHLAAARDDEKSAKIIKEVWKKNFNKEND